MTTLLNLQPIVDQLKAECPLLDNRVSESVSNNDAAMEFYGSPAAFVYLASDTSEPNYLLTGIVQAHTSSIAVKLSVRKTQTLSDRLNSTDAATLRGVREQVLTALLGFRPAGTEKPLEHQSGELTETERYLVWTDTFTTNDYLTNP